MTINSNSNRKKEEVEAIKKALQKNLYEYLSYPLVNCQYNETLDQFIAYCFVDRNDDDTFVRMNFEYDEAIARICDANVELLFRGGGI